MADFVHFLNGLSTELESHYKEKEYRMDVIVELNSKYFETYFFTQRALEYEMTKDGFFSLPGMIVLDEISYEKIIFTLRHLIKAGYFDYYKGYSVFPKNNTYMHKWYMNKIEFSLVNLKSVLL